MSEISEGNKPPREKRSWKTVLLGVRRELSPSDNPGEVYSQVFENCCDSMVEKKRIKSWKPTVRNSEDDRVGIDYWIRRGPYEYPFQVTSTYIDASKHMIKHPNIYVVYMIDKKTGELKESKEVFFGILSGIAHYNQVKPELRRPAVEEPKTVEKV